MEHIRGIGKLPLPENAFLQRYAKRPGHYTDCYATDVESSVGLEDFITAFYRSPVFKIERMILKLVLSKPSKDHEVEDLAKNRTSEFAAWSVEARDDSQILLQDFSGNTRSWLMVASSGQQENHTRLYFGSAVIPGIDETGEAKPMGLVFKSLMGFHKLYSRLLLRFAKSNLKS